MTLEDLAVTVLETEDPATFGTLTFIELGGDSLSAMRFAALAQERFGVQIAVTPLLGDVPLATVLAEAEARPAAVACIDSSLQEPLPGLSHSQRGMFLIESITGGSPYNLVFTVFTEHGTLDPDRLERAIAATAARHEGLRTVFTEADTGTTPLVLGVDHQTKIDHFIFNGSEARFDGHVRAVTATEASRPFDLHIAPAVRFLHFAHPSGRQALVLTAHHMVLDGLSVGLVLTEIFRRYEGETNFAPGIPLSALISHQERQREAGVWDEQAAFWTKHLADCPSVLELPADSQRPPVQDAAGARSPLDLGPAFTDAVTTRARELGITTFSLLLGAFGLALSRITSARDLLVGVPLVGRATEELRELVGVAGNLVPVRIVVDDSASTEDYLRAVHRSLTLSIDHGQLPFEELVARLGIERTIGCHPLVQACFGMHDQLVPQRLTAGGTQLRVEEGHGGGAQFDLTLLIGQSNPSIAGHLEYATAVWNDREAEDFGTTFVAAARELATETSALVNLRCLTSAAQARLAAINDVRAEFPATSIDALFREVARAHPQAVAVREGDVDVTYAELAAAAVEQARLLRAAGVRTGDRVLLAVDRSIAEAVAVLGITTVGAAYVGIDLSLPSAHIAQIIGKSAPTAIITASTVDTGTHEALRAVPVVTAWESKVWPTELAATTELGDWAPADPARQAYIAFTSGSTGEPKGVSVPHRAIVRLVHEANYVRTGPGETMLRLAPLAFDASTLELWGALLTGATLEVYPADLLPSPTELGEFMRTRGVTVAWLTAGLFRLVEEFAPEAFGGLKQLLTGGDVVPHDHAARALTRHPGLIITNGYGPTENTTFTTTHSVSDPAAITGPLPIGTPIPGTHVYVLDERSRQVPPGAIGELHTGGAGLADGYIGDEVETGRRFGRFSPDVPERLYRTGDIVRLDTHGRLVFLDRVDDQVKLRGYRIELSAISDALKEHPEVKDAVVVVVGGNTAEKRLAAAVVLATGTATDTSELKQALSDRLPAYMVPALWTVVESIPLTANGKVDRNAITAGAAPAVKASASSAPELERIIEIFASAIETTGNPSAERPAVDADTDFFAHGGTSSGAGQLIRLIKDELAIPLRLREFLLTPTPAGIHRIAEKAQLR